MKILLFVMRPSCGGHTRTAVALAEELRRRRHVVEFLIHTHLEPATETPDLITAKGFGLHAMEIRKDGRLRRPLERGVRALLREGQFDGVHVVGYRAGILELARACRREGRFFLWTIPSGGTVRRYNGLNRVVVFTREVAEDVREKSPRTTAHILPARIDFRTLGDISREEVRREVRQRLGIPQEALLVVRVARCHSLYLKGICLGLRLVEMLCQEGYPSFFLHAGYPQESEIVDEIGRMVRGVNERAGRAIAFTETEEVAFGARYMAAADLCIASGRSALESLGLGKTTLLHWGDRYLGAVEGSSIEALADTNFQGRRENSIPDEEADLQAMLAIARERLSDPENFREDRELCARFIRERYSIQGAADEYERLYMDRTVAVEGPLRWYAPPPRILGAVRGRCRALAQRLGSGR